jgi:hypothetical protein
MESNKQQINCELKRIFVGILKTTEQKSRIWIRNPVIKILGSGSISETDVYGVCNMIIVFSFTKTHK